MRNKIQVEEATEVKVSNFYHCVQMTFQCFPSAVPGQTDPTCAKSEQWRHIPIFLGDSQRWGLQQREYRFWSQTSWVQIPVPPVTAGWFFKPLTLWVPGASGSSVSSFFSKLTVASTVFFALPCTQDLVAGHSSHSCLHHQHLYLPDLLHSICKPQPTHSGTFSVLGCFL